MGIQRLRQVELEVLRGRAVKAVIEQGWKQVDVAKLFDISIRTVNEYIHAYKEKGATSLTSKQRGPRKGYNSLVTEEMENDVKEVIETTQTSEKVGLACTGWTRGAVMEYIYKTYGIFYSLSWMRKLLKKWGFTPQKPIKHAIEQKLEEVERWVEEEYPRIEERAEKAKAIIFFGDEAGFRSTDIRGRAYKRRGEKPIAERPVSRLRCNMVCAVSNQGKLIWKIFQENFTAKVFIEFLSMLRSKVRKKIFLIMDNHRVHHSIDVRKWLWKHRKRINFFFFHHILLN